MKENFKNSKYNIDDLKFEFDKSHYNEMKDEQVFRPKTRFISDS